MKQKQCPCLHGAYNLKGQTSINNKQISLQVVISMTKKFKSRVRRKNARGCYVDGMMIEGFFEEQPFEQKPRWK